MLLYIENPNLINEFIKVSRQKVNFQKSFAFLYTNKEISERKYTKKKYLLKFHPNKIYGNKHDQRGERLIH